MPLSQSHYILGNSLVNYAEGGSYSNVPVWMDLFAETAQNSYAVSGRYGFLRDFADAEQLTSQWGFPGVQGSFDGAGFATADLDVIVVTPANFIQGDGPDSAYAGDTRSPLDATLDVLADVTTAHPDARILIYEGWADMAPFADDVPEEGQALQAYHAYNQEEYHDWFVSLVDALNAADPDAEVRLLPVGSILSELLTGPLAGIPPSELYVDTAPHGTDTLYFLSAMVTYQASYGSPPALPDSLPAGIHPTVLEEFDAVNAAIAEGLEGWGLEVTAWEVLDDQSPEADDLPEGEDEEPAPQPDPRPTEDSAEPEPDEGSFFDDAGDDSLDDLPPVPEDLEDATPPLVTDEAGIPAPPPDEPDEEEAPVAAEAGFTARYFDLSPGTLSLESVDFTAPADREETVESPNHIYSDQAIGTGGAADHVAVSYSQTLESSGGVYSVSLQADDHAQLWVDGTLILDSAEAPLETLMTAELALSEGPHAIDLRYLEVTGEATLLYDIARVGDLPEDGFDPTPEGAAILAVLSRTADDQGFDADYAILREEEEPEEEAAIPL